jgi:hypothetical protein
LVGKCLTPTDLVTDLPADFEVFGQAVATDLQYLLGGTTGQVLAKASGTDLDFVWSADAAGMTNPMTTTADVIYSSSGSTPARLGIGTANQVLAVNSGATAPEWVTPGGGKVLQVVYANSTTTTTIASTSYTDTNLSATITPTSATSQILVLVNQIYYFTRTGAGIDQGIGIQILRGATSIYDTLTNAWYLQATGASAGYSSNVGALTYLDSPATTSATTYKTQAKNTRATGSSVYQDLNAPSAITLIEIGA